ncbi:SNF1-related protein kinase catalytic subunit alpha KIN11 [Choanephora cucurbitarum]|uniref:SNF1-related protein kinase catalytic subunit alpha KIN11 n=1 Tax=Choanephora cucurbitarum TaxID=101091 RepID=A0A1C7NPQ2_9FUNG|nr:SNF1-related protein kinase catalytic subunit alpha KIN11 [Choanephora cucurbitarum]
MFNATQLLDTYCGSPFYAAPEMVTATPYRGPPVDMWSCGVILYAMLTGQLPFHCDTMPELFKKISMADYCEPSTLSTEALDLIRSLLCRNPKRRMTAEGVLKHAWLHHTMTKKKKRSQKEKSTCSVVDEEALVACHQQSKAMKFLLYIHRKSQVGPTRREKPKEIKKKHLSMLETAHRFKQFISTAFIQKRLTTL